MHAYDADDPRVSDTGVIPDDAELPFSAELVIEGFDGSGFHLRVGDYYYCAKNAADLIIFCIDFFEGWNSDCYR